MTTLPVPSNPFSPRGKRVGPYEIVDRLGAGAMGHVYEARHPDLPRTVALKLIRDLSDVARARFLREGRLLARIKHPGVVAVHELGDSPDGPYLVTQILDGRSLRAALEDEPMEPTRAASLLYELTDAVAAVHDVGIVHRDLKPENVILRPDGAPVLIDFGVAFSASEDRLTKTGGLVGTPHFMAPEQIAGRDGVDPDQRVDVYGLGAILFNLLSGHPPFAPILDIGTLAVAIADGKDPGWGSLGAPPALVAIGRRATAADPAKRYSTARELRDALGEVIAGRAEGSAPLLPIGAAVLAVGALIALGAGLLFREEAPAPAPPTPAPAPAPPPAPAPTPEPAPTPAPVDSAVERDRPTRWRQVRSLDMGGGLDLRGRVAFSGPDRAMVHMTHSDPGFWYLRDGSHTPIRIEVRDLAFTEVGRSRFAVGASGQLLLLAGEDQPFLACIPTDGRPGRVVPTEEQVPVELCLTDDESQVVVGSRNGRLLRIDIATTGVVGRQWHSNRCPVGALAVRGDLVASASDDAKQAEQDFHMTVWRGPDMKPLRRFDLNGVSTALAIHPGGAWAAVGTNAGRVFACDIAEGTQRPLAGKGVTPDTWVKTPFTVGGDVPVAHGTAIRSVVFSPDGRRLYTVSMANDEQGESILRTWDTTSLEELAAQGLGVPATGVDLSADGTRLLIGSWGGEFLLFEPESP